MVHEEATIAAPADRVYESIVKGIGRWWDPAHTYSGESKNLTIDPVPGGCFCEKLPDGGGVSHLTVVFVSPGKLIRFSGALGPLQQGGLAGSMTYKPTPAGDATRCEVSYAVGGYFKGGLDATAPAVDHVQGGQLERLKRYVETGEPAAR